METLSYHTHCSEYGYNMSPILYPLEHDKDKLNLWKERKNQNIYNLPNEIIAELKYKASHLFNVK